MRTRLFTAALAAVFPLAVSAASLGAYSDLVVFGDSSSDPGNAFVLSGGTIPDPLLYPLHQFTNGDTWATKLGADLTSGTNFAVGGAKAVTDGDPSPDLAAQIAAFGAAAPALGPKPLAAIWVGGNDIRAATSPADLAAITANAVTAISNGVSALIGGGLSDIVVMGLPNLGRLPGVVADPALSTTATAASVVFNNTLRTALASFSGLADVRYFDSFGVFESVFADPAAFGFTNTTDACIYLVTCLAGDPNDFVFYDDLHVTDRAHAVIADAFADFTSSTAVVPLPAGGLLLLAGLGGLALVRRKPTPG